MFKVGNTAVGWGAYVTGFNVDFWSPSYNFPEGAFLPTSYYAYFDTTTDVVQIPQIYYDFIMERIMKSSVGFFYDSILGAYVASCA